MKTIAKIIIALLFSYAVSAFGETIKYSLYEIQDGKRILLSEGEKSYTEANFVVSQEYRNSMPYGFEKNVEIYNGYGVGFLDTRDKELTGFGLHVIHLPKGSNPNEFSWEWFDIEKPGLFKKLQGGGLVKVSTTGFPLYQEISKIEFLSDIELDYKKDICCKSAKDQPSNILVIKTGSILVFPKSVVPNKSLKDAP